MLTYLYDKVKAAVNYVYNLVVSLLYKISDWINAPDPKDKGKEKDKKKGE